MKRLAYLVLVSASCISMGCAYANPRTAVYGGPFGWGINDSKDNDVSFDRAEFDPETGKFVVENFKIKNDASTVRIANVEQMKVYEEQARTILAGLTDLASMFPTPPGWLPPLHLKESLSPPPTEPAAPEPE